MTLIIILLFISIIIGCHIAKKDDSDEPGKIIMSFFVFMIFMIAMFFITLCSPRYSEYSYHTVYTNNMDASITVKTNENSSNEPITITGGTGIKGISTSDLE